MTFPPVNAGHHDRQVGGGGPRSPVERRLDPEAHGGVRRIGRDQEVELGHGVRRAEVQAEPLPVAPGRRPPRPHLPVEGPGRRLRVGRGRRPPPHGRDRPDAVVGRDEMVEDHVVAHHRLLRASADQRQHPGQVVG